METEVQALNKPRKPGIICRLFHTQVTRPVNGAYQCLECLREYDCDWDGAVKHTQETAA